MLSRFLRYCLATALLGLFLVTIGHTQEEQDNGSDRWPEQISKSFPLPFPVEIVEDQVASSTRRLLEEQARQRDIADLTAQQGMAEATWAMNTATQDMRDYAYAQTILVAAGTLLLFVTLALTWQANRAAVASVRITREIGIAQTTAYLGIDDLQIELWDLEGDLQHAHDDFSYLVPFRCDQPSPRKVNYKLPVLDF